MGEYLEYNDVVQEVRGAMHPGRLKLTSSNIVFKNIKTGKLEQFDATNIEKVNWLQRARGHCLKIMLENGNIHRFDGLRESEYDKVSQFISKNYNTNLEKVELSYRGWNWGKANFIGSALNFDINEKTAFEIPLNNVSHSMTGKNEVTLEFHQNDDAQVSLMEVRFHIPSDPAAEGDPVNDFYNNVISKADVIQATGESICIFQETQCLTPRGRYDIKIYPTFAQLHGKTFDYKIPYTSVLRLFLLPHRDGRQMFFVVSLDPPIKQGQTRYPFLILLFNKEDEMTLEINLTEEEVTEKYEGKLQKEMSGLEYEIISRVMMTLVNRKITVPGSFMGNSGTQSVACSYKAATGFLYPLERGFIFLHKPPIHIRFDEIACVNFARGSGTTRSFDFEVETKTSGDFTFIGVEKDEYGKLFDFVTQKKLRVKNIGGKPGKGGGSYNDDLVDSDEEGGHDAYLERMKAEGKGRNDDDLDDDSDSSDESFRPDGSGSDVALEYDSQIETSSGDSSDPDYSGADAGESDGGSEAEERKERREAKKKEKEKKKQKSRTVSEKPRKPRKSKGDPTKPKRGSTAYMLWLNHERESIKSEHPGASVTDIAKIGGEKWRAMTPDDKKQWEEKAGEEKTKYEKAMEEWLKDNPQTKSPKKKAAAKKTAGTKTTPTSDNKTYKSQEYISDSDSDSSDSDDSDKPLKKPTPPKKAKKGSDKEEGMSGVEEGKSGSEGGADDEGSGSDAGGSDSD